MAVFLGLIAIIHLLVSLVQLFGLSKMPTVSAVEETNELPPISLIIAARNEAENLKLNLASFLALDYPTFEIIVVNDFSTDETLKVLGTMQLKNAHLKVINNVEQGGKKSALSLGIKQAKFDHLVFTDADCLPSSKDFLRKYGRSFSTGSDLVLGVGLSAGKASIWQVLHQIETMRIAVRYLCASVFNWTYMGVGRSIGYTRELFDQVGGFASHSNVLSGDDDLFVQSMPESVRIAHLPSALTYSPGQRSLTSWFAQKRRHLSTGNHYPPRVLIVLGFIEFTEWLFTVGMLLSIVLIPPNWSIILGLYFVGLLGRYFVYREFLRQAQTNLHASGYFLLEPILYLMNPLFSVASQMFGEPTEWTRKT